MAIPWVDAAMGLENVAVKDIVEHILMACECNKKSAHQINNEQKNTHIGSGSNRMS